MSTSGLPKKIVLKQKQKKNHAAVEQPKGAEDASHHLIFPLRDHRLALAIEQLQQESTKPPCHARVSGQHTLDDGEENCCQKTNHEALNRPRRPLPDSIATRAILLDNNF